MDPGVAAVLGAGIGAVGAALTALATAWAMRWQTRFHASAAHKQWRREARRDAYIGFISAGRTMSWNTGRLRDELTGDERAEVLSAASRARSDLLQAAQLVGFEGPEPLSEALHPVIALSWEIIRAAQDFAEPRHERTLDEIHPDFAKALAEFRVAARHALEADE